MDDRVLGDYFALHKQWKQELVSAAAKRCCPSLFSMGNAKHASVRFWPIATLLRLHRGGRYRIEADIDEDL
jgi:hypothetical protein